MSSPQVWFVTGASSGFGRSMVEYVLSKGDIAVATLRKPEVLDDLKSKHPASRLLILKLDVIKSKDITDAFAKTQEVFGRIDVVFNNAGYAIISEVEGTPEDVARALFEVNFWGADRISREAVRFFRDVNGPGIGGRLLNNSSIGGFNAFPGVGYYCASKSALEGITESLAGELDPEWNIKITIIEPGRFTTKAVDENLDKLPQHPAYMKTKFGSYRAREFVANATIVGADPNKAVQRFYDLAHLPDPPLRFTIGKDAIVSARGHLQNVAAGVDKYESWSEGIDFDQEV